MDGSHLPLVHIDALCANDVTKERDGGFVELTLLQFEVKMVFSQLLQDLLNVVAMVGQGPGVDKDVIYVHYDKAMEELTEHLIYKSLE